MSRKFLLLMLAAFGGLSFAIATCASAPFQAACSKCAFDSYGKMDEACWKGYESEGKTCLATSYPKMVFEYEFGDGCSQLDTCVSRLAACKELQKTGNDASDCKRFQMINCYTMADFCAEAANKVCAEGKSEAEAGFNNISALEPDETGEKPSGSNTSTVPDNYDDQGAALEDFVCGEQGMFLVLLLLAVFVKQSG